MRDALNVMVLGAMLCLGAPALAQDDPVDVTPKNCNTPIGMTLKGPLADMVQPRPDYASYINKHATELDLYKLQSWMDKSREVIFEAEYSKTMSKLQGKLSLANMQLLIKTFDDIFSKNDNPNKQLIDKEIAADHAHFVFISTYKNKRSLVMESSYFIGKCIVTTRLQAPLDRFSPRQWMSAANEVDVALMK